MKKSLLVTLAALSLVFGLPLNAAAQDVSPAPSLQPTKGLRQEVRQDVKDLRQDVRQDLQAGREQIRSDIASAHANRLERRFRFYYDRLSGIAHRLQLRLDTLKAGGRDTTQAQKDLDDAVSKLSNAQSKGEQAVNGFRAIDPAKFAEQKSQALAARDLANDARSDFKAALALLKTALKEAK